MPLPLTHLEHFALLYFLLMWSGYAYYAKYRARNTQLSSLSRALRSHREAWAARLLHREMRMTDAAVLANQERVVGFFASTTLLIMAAVLTALTTSEQIVELTSHIPFSTRQTIGQVQAKLALLMLVLTFAFFKVTWSLRQYGFATMILGAAPSPGETISEQQREAFVCNLAKLVDEAGHNNNSGLRAYYFALSLLCWLIGTELFVVATTLTVIVLYHRECNSRTVHSIVSAHIPLTDTEQHPAD
jgi:uncharacterized membrane protein